MTKLIRILLAATLGFGLPLAAQQVSITSATINDLAGNPLNGQLCLTSSIPFTSSTGILVYPSKKCTSITNGALATTSVWDTSLTTPANVCYAAQILTSGNQGVGTYPCIQPTGTTWSLSAYIQSQPAYQPVQYPINATMLQGWPISTQNPATGQCQVFNGSIYVPQTCGSGGGGSGTVTTFSFTNANGFAGTVLNPTTTPALTLGVDGTHYLPTLTDETNWNGKQAALGFTPLNPANNLSDVANAATARTNLGAQTALGYTPAHSGANSDINSLTGLTTPLSVAQGGTGNATGNAATATALAANPANCSAGQAAAGITANGTAEGCFTPSGGASLPTATAAGQTLSSTAAGTTYAAQPQIFYSESGDTIASIEAECSSACTYISTIPQTFTLAASHTLSSNVNLLFYQGGEWTVNGAFTLTIPTQVQGSLSQHFAGSSTLALGNAQLLTPVEWFGAASYPTYAGAVGGTDATTAIQACLNAIVVGQCQLQAQFYRTTTTLTVTKSYVGLQGPSMPRGGMLAVIVLTSATGDILDLTGTSGSNVTYNVFRNFSLERSTPDTGSDAGFHGSFAGGTLVQYVLSMDSLYPFFLHAMPSLGLGGVNQDVAAWCYVNGVAKPTTGTPMGFRLDSTDGNAESSLTLRDDSVANGCGSSIGAVGTELIGTALNDVNSYNFNTGGVDYGVVMDYTGGAGTAQTSDIHFLSGTHDGFYISAYLIENLNAATLSSVSIVDGWVSGYRSTSTRGIDIENSNGITVSDVLITKASGGMTAGIYASGSSGLSFTGNAMFNMGSANDFQLVGTVNSTIAGNSMSGGQEGVYLQNNSNYNTITGNAIGNLTGLKYGINLQSGSANNQGFTTNSFDATVTTPVNDGSGNNTNQIGPTLNGLTVRAAVNAGSYQVGGVALAASNLSNGTTGTGAVVLAVPTLYSAAGTALPTCAAGIQGETLTVKDATSTTYMGAYTSGGGITAQVICSYNGTTYSWLTH